MKRRLIWLAAASITYGSPHVFSVGDDLLAYPQYEIIFSDTYISDKDANSRLALAASRSSTSPQPIPTLSQDASTSPPPAAELSQRRQQHPDSSSADLPTDTSSSPPDSYERMILNSKPYLCTIPLVSPPSKNTTTHARAAAEEAAELARATDRGYDLLKSMSGSCLYFISGWWSYSFCYNNHVKQFHQLPPGKGTPIFPPVEDPATPSYVLGKFGEVRNKFAIDGAGGAAGGGGGADREAGLPPEQGDEGRTTEIQAKGTSTSRYLSQKLSGGTTCDLTGSPRRVEIQFHCHPQSADRIGLIKEVSTCSYLMIIYTTRLCDDVAFLPPREERANGITCREVVRDEEVEDWERRKKGEAERKLVGDGGGAGNKDAIKTRPIVAGIEVGAMNLVGRDGKRLSPPQNIQPNNQNPDSSSSSTTTPPSSDAITLITRAPLTQGGRIQKLTDRELKKMGLDPGVVEAARRELEELAGGKGWRLEVFEARGGRELRGVVDSEEGEGEGGEGEEEEVGEGGSEEEYRDEL